MLPTAVFAQQQQTYTFVSIGTPLSEAFDQFIEQSGINVAFEIDLVEGKKAFCRAVDLPAEEVIVCLLKDTDLDYIRLSSGTYALVEKAKVEAQWGEITGRVVDVESGEPLPNAHVLLADAGVGDVTNGAGRFAFANLKPGPHRVVVSYLGYQDIADTVDVAPEKNARIELGLSVEPLISSPIVVNGLSRRHSAESLSAVESDVSELLNASVNQDIIKSLNTIIGVRVGDVMADVHVQGGDAGEHQYRLDGAPVFIPIPNGGVVGPFSPFALEKFTIHKAGFSASKGSHLSGVIEAEHRLTPLSTNTFDLQVDPLSVNARAMGSIGEKSGLYANWMLAGRKALWSVFQPVGLQNHFNNWSSSDLHMLNSMFAQKEQAQVYSSAINSNAWQPLPEDARTQFNTADFSNNFDFHDLHGAARLHFNPLSSLHASFYRGGNSLGDDRVVQGRFVMPFSPNQTENRLFNFHNNYKWTNTVAQVRYENVLGSRTFAEWGGWYSQFDGVQNFDQNVYRGGYKGHQADSLIKGRPVDGIHSPPDSLAALGLGHADTNDIKEIGLRATVNHAFGDRNFFSGGIEAVNAQSDFVLNLIGPRNASDWAPNQATIRADQFRLASYLDHKYTFNERTALDLGVRMTYLGTHQQVFAEPRISLRHDTDKGPLGPWAFRGAVGLYRQFVNQFDISSVNRNALVPSMRFWLPLDETEKPAKAIHASGAVLLSPHQNWQIHLESYYKLQPHLLVIDYANASLFGAAATNLTTQSELLQEASGFAYGAAISVERKTDQLSTKLQYEFSVAEQKVANRFGGESISVPWNVPHRFVTSLSYKVTDQVTILSRLENKIGQSWAFRNTYYNFLEPNPNTASLGNYNLSDPASHKLPMIAHLDFGISFSQKLKDTNLQVRFDLSNILSTYNVEEWSLAYDPQSNAVYKVERPLTPFLPSMVIRLGF